MEDKPKAQKWTGKMAEESSSRSPLQNLVGNGVCLWILKLHEQKNRFYCLSPFKLLFCDLQLEILEMIELAF